MTRDLFWFSDQSCATTLWVLPHQMLASCKVWCSYVFWRKKYFVFSLSRDLMWPGDQTDMWFHGCVYVITSHQLATFHGYRPCQKRYVTLLIYQVTTHRLRITELYRCVPLTISHRRVMFGSHRPCRRGDIKFSIDHVALRDHVIRGSSDITGEFPAP